MSDEDFWEEEEFLKENGIPKKGVGYVNERSCIFFGVFPTYNTSPLTPITKSHVSAHNRKSCYLMPVRERFSVEVCPLSKPFLFRKTNTEVRYGNVLLL